MALPKQSHQHYAGLSSSVRLIQLCCPQALHHLCGAFEAAQVPCTRLSTSHPSVSFPVQRSQHSAAGSAWHHRRSSARLADQCVHVKQGFALSCVPAVPHALAGFLGQWLPRWFSTFEESLILCEARFLSRSPRTVLYVAESCFSGGGSQSKAGSSHLPVRVLSCSSVLWYRGSLKKDAGEAEGEITATQ